MRGEHQSGPICAGSSQGSSPHARGAQKDSLTKLIRDGIIPACAGSTDLPDGTADADRDHPRMRGEHTVNVAIVDKYMGSSPHARGAQDACRCLVKIQGIIPACAGSTDQC